MKGYRYAYVPARYSVVVGADPVPMPSSPPPAAPANGGAGPEETETFSITGIASALRNITPTVLVIGIATGFAFAIGGALGSMLIRRFSRR